MRGPIGRARPGAAGPTEATTQEFTDSLGREVTVPTRPQRIVSLHEWSSAEALLTLGAPVVGLPLSAIVDDADPEVVDEPSW